MLHCAIWLLAVMVVLSGCGQSSQEKSFSVPSAGMLPTLTEGQVVKVRAINSHDRVERGEIIVFETPPGVSRNFKDLVKRVIGLPDETIAADDGHVYINGQLLAEPWLPNGEFTAPGFDAVTVPADSYFVLGDNRGASADSRVFGSIPRAGIIGTVKHS